MGKVKINDIIIPEYLKDSKPSGTKLGKIIDYYYAHGKMDQRVMISQNNVLLDGYARYYAAIKLGLDSVDCRIGVSKEELSNPFRRYIKGKHKNGNVYCWKLPMRCDPAVGDLMLVNTNINGKSVVEVVEVFESDDPDMRRHKKAIKVFRKRPANIDPQVREGNLEENVIASN